MEPHNTTLECYHQATRYLGAHHELACGLSRSLSNAYVVAVLARVPQHTLALPPALAQLWHVCLDNEPALFWRWAQFLPSPEAQDPAKINLFALLHKHHRVPPLGCFWPNVSTGSSGKRARAPDTVSLMNTWSLAVVGERGPVHIEVVDELPLTTLARIL